MSKNITSTLPSNEKTVTLEVKGETTGHEWKGKFVIVRMPTIGMIAQSNVIVARLNADLETVNPTVKTIHNMLAQCQTRILEAPDWWFKNGEGRDLLDMNVLGELYKTLVEAEIEYRNEVWGPPEEEKEEEKPKKVSESETTEAK